MRTGAGGEVPAPLRGKESVIFGNLEDICHFHRYCTTHSALPPNLALRSAAMTATARFLAFVPLPWPIKKLLNSKKIELSFFLCATLLNLGLNSLFLASIFHFWPHHSFSSFRFATLASFFSPFSSHSAALASILGLFSSSSVSWPPFSVLLVSFPLLRLVSFANYDFGSCEQEYLPEGAGEV
jgi:hypothetical protein